jgi:hypothetical protein
MKKCVVASVLVFGMASSAWAATADMWFVTVDTVGNCSVGQGKPSEGQTAFGETGGYASMADAKNALDGVRGDDSKCKGVVE